MEFPGFLWLKVISITAAYKVMDAFLASTNYYPRVVPLNINQCSRPCSTTSDTGTETVGCLSKHLLTFSFLVYFPGRLQVTCFSCGSSAETPHSHFTLFNTESTFILSIPYLIQLLYVISLKGNWSRYSPGFFESFPKIECFRLSQSDSLN